MAVKLLALRRNRSCAACTGAIAAGARAWWDSDAHSHTCTECQPIDDAGAVVDEVLAVVEDQQHPPRPQPQPAGTPSPEAMARLQAAVARQPAAAPRAATPSSGNRAPAARRARDAARAATDGPRP